MPTVIKNRKYKKKRYYIKRYFLLFNDKEITEWITIKLLRKLCKRAHQMKVFDSFHYSNGEAEEILSIAIKHLFLMDSQESQIDRALEKAIHCKDLEDVDYEQRSIGKAIKKIGVFE